MKRILVVFAVCFGWVSVVQAQYGGFPIANNGASGDIGELTVLGGAMFSDEVEMIYNGRLNYRLSDIVQVFADVGGVNQEAFDDVFAVQGGGVLSFSTETTASLGLRLAGYMVAETEGWQDNVFLQQEVYGGNLSLVGGVDASSVTPGLSLYGAVGVNFEEIDRTASVETDPDDGAEPSGAVGLMLPFTPAVAIYAEVGYLDAVFGGGGLRFTF